MRKIGDLLEKFLKGVLNLMLVLLMGAVVIQVFNRYVIHYSLPTLQWLIMLTFAWITFLGSAVAIRKNAHFDIDILEKRLSSPALRKGVRLGIQAIILLCVVIMLITGWSFLQIGLLKKSPATGYSMVWTYASIFVSAVFMAFFILEKLLETLQLKEL